MYKFGIHSEITIESSDADYVYLKFIGVSIRVSRHTYIAERLGANGKWAEIKWRDNGSKQMRTSLYNGTERKTLARGRLICFAINGAPTGEKQFVLHKNGNTMDDNPDNIEWADSLNKFRCKYRTPEMIEAISKIPVSQRNWQNPEYMKLYNSLKGADGLNHADRFRLKQKALGLVRKYTVVDGKKKYFWAPKKAKKQE